MIISKDKQTARYKASEYIYDLGNTALENGFKSGENWEVHMATAAEKKSVRKAVPPHSGHQRVARPVRCYVCPCKSAVKPGYQAGDSNRTRPICTAPAIRVPCSF